MPTIKPPQCIIQYNSSIRHKILRPQLEQYLIPSPTPQDRISRLGISLYLNLFLVEGSQNKCDCLLQAASLISGVLGPGLHSGLCSSQSMASITLSPFFRRVPITPT